LLRELTHLAPVCVKRGIPAWIVCPGLAVVKQTALDVVCGPTPTESAGSGRRMGWLSWRKVVGGGSGK